MAELTGILWFVGFIMGIVWFIFPFTVAHGITKQRQANRRIVAELEAIAKEMRELNSKIPSPHQQAGVSREAAASS